MISDAAVLGPPYAAAQPGRLASAGKAVHVCPAPVGMRCPRTDLTVGRLVEPDRAAISRGRRISVDAQTG
jgi:hypothetical protein